MNRLRASALTENSPRSALQFPHSRAVSGDEALQREQVCKEAISSGFVKVFPILPPISTDIQSLPSGMFILQAGYYPAAYGLGIFGQANPLGPRSFVR
jgi:hypothetical protein